VRQTQGVLVVLLLLAASAASAQERPPDPGERVRLKAPRVDAHPIRGRLVEIDESALILDAEAKPSVWERVFGVPLGGEPPRRLHVPLDAVRTLEVARGKKSNWPAAFAAGAVIGGGATLLGAAAYGSSGPCVATEDPDCGDGRSLVLAGVAVTAVTVVAFGLFAKTDRWVDVTPARTRLTVAPTPGRGVAVALSIRF
jgi:hypothetical protein